MDAWIAPTVFQETEQPATDLFVDGISIFSLLAFIFHLYQLKPNNFMYHKCSFFSTKNCSRSYGVSYSYVTPYLWVVMTDLNGMKWTVFCQTTRWCNWCLLFTTAERSLSTRHANGWSNLQIPIRFATVGTIDWYERNLTVVFRSARRWNWWLLLRQNVYWNILFGTCKICMPVLQLVGRLASN
jgi:hypothetical protein